jgi:hypothetical protein
VVPLPLKRYSNMGAAKAAWAARAEPANRVRSYCAFMICPRSAGPGPHTRRASRRRAGSKPCARGFQAPQRLERFSLSCRVRRARRPLRGKVICLSRRSRSASLKSGLESRARNADLAIARTSGRRPSISRTGSVSRPTRPRRRSVLRGFGDLREPLANHQVHLPVGLEPSGTLLSARGLVPAGILGRRGSTPPGCLAAGGRRPRRPGTSGRPAANSSTGTPGPRPAGRRPRSTASCRGRPRSCGRRPRCGAAGP